MATLTGAYVGRFAPSPTGPLHMGSLVAALGSFLRARANAGEWLLRIEDIDPPREQPGASESILRCLEAHGLLWDREVLYQHNRIEAYEAACDQLLALGEAYFCRCSRKQVSANAVAGPFGPVYNGHCRDLGLSSGALRVRTQDEIIGLEDQRSGWIQQNLGSELGDFVLRRADGLFAYQLAVVIDDAFQGVTEVVRGADLLDNTPRQRYLQRLLGLATPAYLHLPLVCNASGQKLSKQNHAAALQPDQAASNLLTALRHLGFSTHELGCIAQPTDILSQAVSLWQLSPLAAVATPACPHAGTSEG